MKSEMARRQSGTAQVIALLRSQPQRWIHWRRFAAIAACAWRTRISDARKQLKAEGLVEWNNRPLRSAYRFRPQAQGRSAETWAAAPVPLPLYDGPPGAYQR